MARVTGTLTGTTLATTAPPVRPPLLTHQVRSSGPAGVVFADFIPTKTIVSDLQVALDGTAQVVATTAGTANWQCPPGVTTVYVECIGGGGTGATGSPGTARAGGGGGGGAYARRVAVPVTPGTIYTFTVGGAAGDTTFTGDSGTQVIAKGGQSGQTPPTAGAGGSGAASTGDVTFSGGAGGNGSGAGNLNSGAGGASGNSLAIGNAGTAGTSGSPGTGGAGANGGGSGANGVIQTSDGTNGSAPGGGGSGGGGVSPAHAGGQGAPGQVSISPGVVLGFIGTHTVVNALRLDTVPLPFIASTTSVHAPALQSYVTVPFIGSNTTVYALSLPVVPLSFIGSNTTVYALTLVGPLDVPFISSATTVYALTVSGPLNVPFISSHTHVWAISSLFDPNKVYGGPGNGGEAFLVELNANGVTTSATLAADIGVGNGTVTLTGDSGFPTTVAFIVTIDSEQLYLFPRGGGSYSCHGRGMGNTTAAPHSAGASADWGDSYDQAIVAAGDIGHEFTADINSTGSFTYPGWLICFDASQGYLSGDRYPMHVDQVLGVFDAGAGVGGSNRCDGAQPNAVCAPATTSDYCPAALSNPSRIASDITAGDVAVVRYTNPEATVLDLGPRAVTLQSWFGLMRVNTSNGDVTFTDPNGIVVDTTGTYDTFTGSVNGVFAEPLPLQVGIAPDASDAAGHAVPTPNTVPWETVTLPGTDRKFTFGSGGGGYDRAGWPICCLAVRQGKKRVPFWQSWDWRDYSYIYTGFGTDAVYAQLLINRNGIVFDSVPAVSLPGPQDIDGPDAVWDDAAYFYGCSWYVVLFNTPYLVYGPSIGGSFPPGMGGPGSPPGYAPGVTFPPGGPPVVLPPPFIEGGSGGNINPGVAGLHIWATSGKGFS